MNAESPDTIRNESRRPNDKRGLWFILIGSIISGSIISASLWADIFPYGHGTLLDYERNLLLTQYVKQGIFWPGWLIPPFYGYGTPVMQFYAPGYFIGSACLSAIGLSVLTSMKLIWTLSQIVAALGTNLLIRRLLPGKVSIWAGLAASVLYLLAPIHLSDLYVRGGSGSMIGYALWPFALYFFIGFARNRSGLEAAAASLIFGVVIFTHNISALFLGAMLVALPYLFVEKGQSAGRIARHLMLMVLGAAAAAAFWLPAMTQMKFIRIAEGSRGGYFDYHRHFVEILQLIWSPWGYGTSEPGAADTMTLQLGIPHLIALAAAILLIAYRFRKNKKIDRLLVFCTALGFASLFMTLSASDFLWRTIPLAKWVQFPWRYLCVTALAASIAAAGAIARVEEYFGSRLSKIAAGIFIGLAVALYLPCAMALGTMFDPSTLRPMIVHPDKVKEAASAGMLRPEKILTIDYLRNYGKDLTTNHDYVPIWVRSLPDGIPPQPAFMAASEGKVIRFVERSMGYDIDVETLSPGRMVIQCFYFPGWKARTDKAELKVKPWSDKGLLSVEVPVGSHHIEVRYARTPVVVAGEIISASGILIALALPFLLLFCAL